MDQAGPGNPYKADLVQRMDVIARYLEIVAPPSEKDPLYPTYKEAKKACGEIINQIGNLADLKAGDACPSGLPRRSPRA
jgi:hypothetical protein